MSTTAPQPTIVGRSVVALLERLEVGATEAGDVLDCVHRERADARDDGPSQEVGSPTAAPTRSPSARVTQAMTGFVASVGTISALHALVVR